jgi:hypothetical protein
MCIIRKMIDSIQPEHIFTYLTDLTWLVSTNTDYAKNAWDNAKLMAILCSIIKSQGTIEIASEETSINIFTRVEQFASKYKEIPALNSPKLINFSMDGIYKLISVLLKCGCPELSNIESSNVYCIIYWWIKYSIVFNKPVANPTAIAIDKLINVLPMINSILEGITAIEGTQGLYYH